LTPSHELLDLSIRGAPEAAGSLALCSTTMSAGEGPAACPLLEAAEAVRSGRVSSEELVTQALKRLEDSEGDVGAFLSVQGRAALETARAIDQRVAEGCKDTLALPLLGVPLGVKDNLCTEGVPTTAGSRILEGYRPSYDASVVSKLKLAGGIALGKTNMD
ncbi:unnamed protein product, partial [Hapterophycus canaliculatus]